MRDHDVISLKPRKAFESTQRSFISCNIEFKIGPTEFFVHRSDGSVIQTINFQDGPINEVGVNGVMNEDLLTMAVVRLEAFQASPFKCDENQEALEYINKALEALNRRTQNRIERGVEGTHVV
jgi:hypothetical protein